MQTGNFFAHLGPPAQGERFDELLRHKNLLIERIVSSSLITPVECVQPQDEWVMLVQGEATLDVSGQVLRLQAGDHVFLPAGLAHTVLAVSPGALWLAVHLHPEAALPQSLAEGAPCA